MLYHINSLFSLLKRPALAARVILYQRGCILSIGFRNPSSIGPLYNGGACFRVLWISNFGVHVLNSGYKSLRREMRRWKYIWIIPKRVCLNIFPNAAFYILLGGRATDRRSSDRPFNRPTYQRNPTEKYHGKKFSMMPSDRIENSARWHNLNRYFSLFFLEFVSATPKPTLAAAHGPLSCFSRSARCP